MALVVTVALPVYLELSYNDAGKDFQSPTQLHMETVKHRHCSNRSECFVLLNLKGLIILLR